MTSLALFAALAISPLIFKIAYITNTLHASTGVRSFGALQVIANDAAIYLIILTLFYLSSLNRISSLLSVIFRILAVFTLAIYVVDFWVIKNFNSHLVASDVMKYAPYSLKYAQQIYNEDFLWRLMLVLPGGALVLSSILSSYRIEGSRGHIIFGAPIISLLLVSASTNSSESRYVHSWAYKNVIEHNLTLASEGRKYSLDFIRRFHFEEPSACDSKDKKRPNIILLMVESLSAYQSNYFSGVRDWTPELDKIAQENNAFTNFYANGFTTEDAEVALLTGQQPIYAPSSYSNGGETSFVGFYNLTDTLPRKLENYGYETEFLTSADLSFSNTGGWAESIGFKYVEGHEHTFYDNWKRFHFKAAPDEALYQRLLARMDFNKERSYFLFAKTVSTHHPFINPDNNNRSEEEAFRYADRQIGILHQQLIENNFFDNGLLIIVGDHHSMVPLKKGEADALGEFRAAARVPLIIAGGDYVAPSKNAYQQVDVPNSIAGLVSGKNCYSDWIGNIFTQKPASYISHRRGDNRNIISVFTDDIDYLVYLNGDKTSIDSSYGNTAAEKQVLGKINAVRILRQKIEPVSQ